MSDTKTADTNTDKGSDTQKVHQSSDSVTTALQRSPSKEDVSRTPTPPSVSTSLPVRLTRKRAASLMARGETRHPEPLSLTSSPLPSRKADSASQVCLCQPEPKVRRPRNAFILYRQHYQASVVAQNPGLANPEISKIIGEQWRQQSAEIKNEWKVLAEVGTIAEHSLTYSNPNFSLQEEKLRHQQQYPDYRYQPRRSGRGSSILGAVSTSSSASGEIPRCTKCGGRSIATPNTPLTPFTPSAGTPNLLPPLTPTSTSSENRFLPLNNSPMAAPPNLRRRMGPSPGGMGVLQIASIRDQQEEEGLTPLSPDGKKRRLNAGGYALNGAGNGTGTPFPFPSARRQSLPRPDALARPYMQMAPPPRPGHHDPSLTLPPLQTSQERSVEAMVMTIPYINKIKVLNRISPPVKSPGPASPPHKTRGAIIAVDGTDQQALTGIITWLQEFLQRGDEYTVKVIESPNIPFPSKSDKEISKQDTDNDFTAYLRSITEWHTRSADIVDYLTTDPSPTSSTPQSTTLPPTSPPAQPTASPRRPIALINRYQLTLSDNAATHIAIDDAYAPIDHWQWMATLWRGIVGPDITVYVKEASGEELNKFGGVEVRGDAKAMVVRLEKGKACEERALRRLGFEVGEWVRGIGKEGSAYGGA
ncbi:MAG: hypothetical protein M1812_004994 [Candelaria pacifica]|nr:MAG: hypothetical protein M1812_004994 [Candelaria pacifica]